MTHSGAALAITLLLGMVEFITLNRALKSWTGMAGIATFLLAAGLSAVPLVGGVAALLAAILVLEWPWWMSGLIFAGGSLALGLTGGLAALLGAGSFF